MDIARLIRSLTWLAVFAGTWLLLSGIFKPLTLWLGAASCITTLIVFHRMENISPRGPLYLKTKPVAMMGYLFWLLGEIVKSTWAVTKAILSPDIPIRQHFFKVPYHQDCSTARTVFANSITLTPGTITVEVEDKYFWVHAVQFSKDDHAALAEMDKRVCATEKRDK